MFFDIVFIIQGILGLVILKIKSVYRLRKIVNSLNLGILPPIRECPLSFSRGITANNES